MFEQFSGYKLNSNFTMIPNITLQDPELSGKALAILCRCLSFPKDWQMTFNGLLKKFKEGRDWLRSGINELIENGYVIKTETKGSDGTFQGVNYQIYPFKYSQMVQLQSIGVLNLNDKINTDIPKTEKPLTADPFTEKPFTADPTAYKEYIDIKTIKEKEDIFESETQKPHISSSQVEVVEGDRTDTPSPQKETNKSSLANKNTSEKTDFPSGNTEETILRDKLKSLHRKGYRRWSEDQVAFLRDQLSPFFEVWNTHKFPAFYPVTKPSARYLYFLLDFLIREGFEGCLELFEKAVKALSSDPFWTKQGKQRKAEDFPDIQFLIEDPRDYKGHIRKYSDRYRETPQGQQITPEDVEKSIEQKRVRDTAERLRRKFNYQEGIQPC